MVPEFLDFIVSLVKANRPFLPLIDRALRQGATRIYVFAPDVGGSAALLEEDLRTQYPGVGLMPLPPDALSSLNAKPHGAMIASINHAHLISDEELSRQICEMSEKADFILIGEGNNKSFRQVIGMTILGPLVALVLTPRIRPFRASRLIFTYLIPILPIVTAWDGIIALVRIRTPKKILSLAQNSTPQWTWESGKLPNGRGGFIIYLYGARK